MKLGKILHLFVASILLFSTIGVVINKHYSGGELFSTALFVEAESCCASSCCHEKPVSGCSEEADYYRLVADYIVPENSENNFLDDSFFTLPIGYICFVNVDLYANPVVENIALHIVDPIPNLLGLPVLYHSLLI